MGNQQVRRDAAIYLAAMIQGEGSIMLYPSFRGGRSRQSHTVTARIAIYNSDTDVLDAVGRSCEVLQAGHYRYAGTSRNGWRNKPVGVVMVNGFKRLAKLLPILIPFLVGQKKQIAEAVLRLSLARCAVPQTAPYEPWQQDLVDSLCPGRRARATSQTNTSTVASQATKIEPGLLAKA